MSEPTNPTDPSRASAPSDSDGVYRTHEDFDYDSIDASLASSGGAVSHQAKAFVDEVIIGNSPKLYTIEDVAFAFAEYQRWILYGEAVDLSLCVGKLSSRQIAKRVVASAWVLRPALFLGRSLRAICQIKTLGVRRSRMSDLGLQFSDKFGLKARAQKPEASRAVYSRVQKRRKRRVSTGRTPPR